MIQKSKSILFIVSCFCDKFDDNDLSLTLSDTIFVENLCEVVFKLGTKTPFMGKLPARCTMGKVKGSAGRFFVLKVHWGENLCQMIYIFAGMGF